MPQQGDSFPEGIPYPVEPPDVTVMEEPDTIDYDDTALSSLLRSRYVGLFVPL